MKEMYVIQNQTTKEYFVEYKGNFELRMSPEMGKAKVFYDWKEASEYADALHDFQGHAYDVNRVNTPSISN